MTPVSSSSAGCKCCTGLDCIHNTGSPGSNMRLETISSLPPTSAARPIPVARRHEHSAASGAPVNGVPEVRTGSVNAASEWVQHLEKSSHLAPQRRLWMGPQFEFRQIKGRNAVVFMIFVCCTHTHTCVCVCVCVYIYVCVCVCVYRCVSVCLLVRLSICYFACALSVWLSVCLSVCSKCQSGRSLVCLSVYGRVQDMTSHMDDVQLI